MNITILRRKGLGKTSVDGIIGNSKHMIHSVRNDDPNFQSFEDTNVWIRWGCTSTVPFNPDNNRTIWNKTSAIHAVTDKAGFRAEMRDYPEFVKIPRTWFNLEDLQLDMQNLVFQKETSQFILRSNSHSQGKNLYVLKYQEIHGKLYELGWMPGEYYISEYIPKVREYRVYVGFGKVICVAEKIPKDPTQIAWNQSQGASFKNVKWGDWPLEACRMASNACSIVGLDFSGVDAIIDSSMVTYILEVNSAPTLTSKYRQKCFAKVFDLEIDNLDNVVSQYPTFIQPFHSWKDCIHPSLWSD